MKSYSKSININHCRAGLKRAIAFLFSNGFTYKSDHGHRVLIIEFERLTGLKKPEGIKFRQWMGQLYKKGSEFLPPCPVKKKFTKNRLPKKKKVNRRQEYENHIKSPEWRAFREKAFEYYGRECGSCGSRHNLHVHHKHYKNIFHEEIADVMILCEPCHMEVHKRPSKTATYFPDRRM